MPQHHPHHVVLDAMPIAGFDQFRSHPRSERKGRIRSSLSADAKPFMPGETWLTAESPSPILRNRKTRLPPSMEQGLFEKPEDYPPHIYHPLGLAPPSEIGRAVQQECRDRSRMPSSA
eukprot:TRINITY_DN32284_c0_g1_i1.p1 TRINITY_DN32284_c0_g1~~TRINITY_DN32284_c0_g1_i1.p1  ORF type:complete len:135 (-),score=8.89 TRINITY_DN32284_c0_g1_i1:10-363(-)